jgi:hypothetical protein
MVVGSLVSTSDPLQVCTSFIERPFYTPGFLASSSSFLQDRLYFATAAAAGYREMNSGRNEGEKETSTVIERTM